MRRHTASTLAAHEAQDIPVTRRVSSVCAGDTVTGHGHIQRGRGAVAVPVVR